jgi:hypothetical protein
MVLLHLSNVGWLRIVPAAGGVPELCAPRFVEQPTDCAFLANLVAARTGMSQDEAQRRVDDVFNRARDGLKQSVDTARKAAAYVSFWTFMSLLFGAVAATLGGILGGELRDEYDDAGVRTAPA